MRRGAAVFLVLGLLGFVPTQPVLARHPTDLRPCGFAANVLCGEISRALDPADPTAGTIPISFELHPPTVTDQPPLGTIVAVEGGPGYATTESRAYYLDLFAPLLDRRQLLLVDNRGTGGSAAINCSELQSYEGSYIHNVGLCGAQLGSNSDVWGSALAADDMAAVLDSLGIGQVDLYGDSYGTYFGQTFALRHPDRLRTLTLDAAYPVVGPDPWYRDINRAMVDAFRSTCQRDLGCAALGGDVIARIRALADALNAKPLRGMARDADGGLHQVTVDTPLLSYLMGVATFGSAVYRELDAAGRAYLERGDAGPLLRIAAEQITWGDAGPVSQYSEGLYVAVICNDYPQLWDISAPVAARPAQFARSLQQLRTADPNGFAPFTVEEWLASPWTEFRSCIQWPTPSRWVPPVPPPVVFPDVPTLVLVGDLDSITSPEGAAKVASQFPRSTFVEVANLPHVSALDDHGRCASDIVIRYVSTGGDAGDTSCASAYNEVRVVEDFPRRLADVMPLPGVDGSTGRTAIAAANTVADMLNRWLSMYGTRGVGLRGGSFVTTGLDHVRLRMDHLRWVDDVAVSGEVEWNRGDGAIRATVTLSGTVDGHLVLAWNDWEQHAAISVRGTVHGHPVSYRFPAP